MATSNKDFKIKNGLIVEGATASVNGNNVITEASSIDDLSDVSVSGASNGQALVYSSGVWGPATVGGGVGAGTTTYVTGPTAPSSPESGDIWFNTSNGLTSVYYTDADTSQWIQIAEGGLPGPTGPAGGFDTSDTAPSSPSDGDAWFSTTDGKMYFYYEDEDSGQWVELVTAGPQGPQGSAGPTGSTGPAGQGLISGGSAGDILVKASGTDYDFELKSPRIFSTTFVAVNFNQSSYTKMSCFNTSPSVNVGSFSVSSSAVTIPEDGYYMVSWNIALNSAVVRANIDVSLGINDTQDDVLYAAHSYIRNSNGHDTVSSNAAGIVYLSASDTVHIYARQEAEAGTVNSVANVGSFNLHKIY